MKHFERYRDIIQSWEQFIEYSLKPLPTVIWTNTLRITTQRLQELLQQDGVILRTVSWVDTAFRVESSPVSLGTLWEYWAGLYHIQEEVSLLPPYILKPQPGERILDMCAAPGNKTAQMAVLMENTGTIVANDNNRKRIGAIRALADRMGLINISVIVSDGTSFSFKNGQFDRILVDVPCSCEGNSRKTPSVLEECSLQFSLRLAKRQTLLLKRAVELCKPGGIIIYSTCTYAPEENEGVVNAVLNLFPDKLEMLPITIPAFQTAPGLTSWQGQQYSQELQYSIRVYPHLNDTGGFYVALLRKKQ